jgi:uncharacterized protein
MEETDLKKLLKDLKPEHNPGDFVFCTVKDLSKLELNDILMLFKEKEGFTVVIKKEVADSLQIPYSFIASWITLTVHSSLSAVGLTAAFSKVLSENDISCNVVAAYYHDHIFVNHQDLSKAMQVLEKLSD